MGHQITTPTAPVPSITHRDIPWEFAAIDRREAYAAEGLLHVSVDELREYALDLREDLRSVRDVLHRTVGALADVTRDRDRLRQELRELRRQLEAA